MELLAALTGGMFSGKTTLSRCLAESHGFYLMDYTGLLKRFAAKTIGDITGDAIDAQYFEENKKTLRPFLQNLGSVLGFDSGFGVDILLREWEEAGSPPRVVFDNVRFREQFEPLKNRGFVLFGLRVSETTQIQRAKAKGVSAEEIAKFRAHPAESGVAPEVWLDADRSLESNISVFLRLAGQKNAARSLAQAKE